MKRRLSILLIPLLLAGLSIDSATANVELRAGGNEYQIGSGFQEFWEMNNGVEVIGAPLSDEFTETKFDSGASNVVQYFERQRIELHPENAGTPYDVLLGRLGAEVLAKTGQDWTAFPQDDPEASNYHEATGFAVAPEFIDVWLGNGIDLGDSGVSYRESLDLFGHPISPVLDEIDADGNPVMVQWFERARFELRNGVVSHGALGAELLDVPGAADPVTASMLAQVQGAVARFADRDVARAEGWDLVDGLDHCFTNPGVGDMGFHYINANMLDTMVNPLAPEAMVYQPGPDGELSFGAVEWVVPAEAWDAEGHDGLPEALGHTFHLNEELGVYVLHAWLFMENPSGIFMDWNPEVSCQN